MRSWRRFGLVAALTGALVVPGQAARALEGRSWITDDQGRALILHGLNTASSAKSASGLPWIGPDDVALERRLLGTDSVRYLIQWKNVEPSPGVYDEEYLDAVAVRLRWYRDQGMHVILDMHQDIYGPAACAGAGNGAPSWATFTDGLACAPQSPWVLTYLQPAVLRAYDHFWNTTGRHPELGERYAAMWRHVADRFRDEPAVLGYDLMNEPFGGTRQFGFFEGPILTPFHQRIIDAIRTVDAANWIFVEPQSLGVNQGAESSLGALDGDRIVLAPHFYPGAVDLGGSYSGLTKLLVQGEFAFWKHNMTKLAATLGRPLWIGEIGAMDMSVPGGPAYTTDWLKMTEDLMIGYAYWSHEGGTGPDTSINPILNGGLTQVGRIMARPRPRAVAGVPTAIKAAPGSLTVSWTASDATGPTDIWFPGTTAPKVVATDPYTWDPATRTLLVWPGPGRDHTVTVT
ncbi:cellulase family glycosylhydrolase [Actinocorallia longicatena]|uniref:Glycoside hydrolase family 5 domain-containing protein n=1 Tax=Actinocorallia longicatena TaxID=111803 RepID=A0ABP6QLI9_9ACTN